MASHKISYVFRMECDPPVYLWTGYGPLETPADDFDVSGASWTGAGEIISIPAIRQLINGVAERISVPFSGVSAEALRMAIEDRVSVKDAPAMIGRVTFDDDWQIVDGIEWQWIGRGGVITTESVQGQNGQRQWNVSISFASGDVYRGNPNIIYYSMTEQQRRSSDDLFCSHVASINYGVTRRFGPK